METSKASKASDPEIRKLASNLMSAISETDKALADLKKDAEKIRKKYGHPQ
jgi:uncharacterized protein Yka (UPF0111/DUF47 family)